MSRLLIIFFLFIISGFSLNSCDTIFGTKNDAVTDEIFKEGRQDPNLIQEEVGYAALLPFWDDFSSPTDVYVGYDELVYVTDETGLHVLDRAGRRFAVYELDGAVSVVQDRNLNVYVAARIDTIIQAVDPDIVWNLPAVYKLYGLNKGPDQTRVLDIIVHPFRDASRPTASSQRIRLNRDSPINDELVEFTGLTTLADNTLYVSRKGPRNQTGQSFAPDNTVLIYSRETGSETMLNTTQIRALSPNTSSLISGIGLSDIQSFTGPPQREILPDNRGFLIAQADENTDIPFRVLWVNVIETPDGISYQPNSGLLNADPALADGYMYDQNKFKRPSGIAYSADERNQIFVIDAGTDSLHLFQSNGREGVNPPAGSSGRKAVNVSFGGTGNGPREFNEPSGVAYFRRVVFVADKNNNRIARYKLNTDFE